MKMNNEFGHGGAKAEPLPETQVKSAEKTRGNGMLPCLAAGAAVQAKARLVGSTPTRDHNPAGRGVGNVQLVVIPSNSLRRWYLSLPLPIYYPLSLTHYPCLRHDLLSLIVVYFPYVCDYCTKRQETERQGKGNAIITHT
jgi:hypothetical protein